MRFTVLLLVAVISVLPIWKMKTAFESPLPLRVTVPVMPSEDELQYTPGRSVVPPMSPGSTGPGHARPAASLYAAVKSLLAWRATALPAIIVPLITIPGANPVTAVPGLTPRFPFTTVAPVLVTVEPARTAKLLDVPRGTGSGF